MNGMLGWPIAEDCIGDDGYYDEDDIIVNSNDPFKDENDSWSDYNRSESVFADEDCEMRSQFEQFSDHIYYDSRLKAIAVAGAICQSCRQTDIAKESTAEFEEDVVEYISMEEHLENTNIDKNSGIPGIPKQTPRPFEKWVQDIKAGKKTIHDPL